MSKIKISFSDRLFDKKNISILLEYSSNEKLNWAISLAYYQGLKLKDVNLL